MDDRSHTFTDDPPSCRCGATPGSWPACLPCPEDPTLSARRPPAYKPDAALAAELVQAVRRGPLLTITFGAAELRVLLAGVAMVAVGAEVAETGWAEVCRDLDRQIREAGASIGVVWNMDALASPIYYDIDAPAAPAPLVDEQLRAALCDAAPVVDEGPALRRPPTLIIDEGCCAFCGAGCVVAESRRSVRRAPICALCAMQALEAIAAETPVPPAAATPATEGGSP